MLMKGGVFGRQFLSFRRTNSMVTFDRFIGLNLKAVERLIFCNLLEIYYHMYSSLFCSILRSCLHKNVDYFCDEYYNLLLYNFIK